MTAPDPLSLTTDLDRALMGAAIAPIVARDGKRLLALARKSFTDLSPAEERFFRNLGMVVFGDEPPDETDEIKTLRADRLAWVLLDQRALRILTPRGIMVTGASIEGQLNLIKCQANSPLILDACRFDRDILLYDAHLTILSLERSQCQGLQADRIVVPSGMFLRNQARFQAMVRFLYANIGCDLDCSGSSFTNKDGVALYADGVKVKGSVFLKDKATFQGEVRLPHAMIDGILTCKSSLFCNNRGMALNADHVTVNGSVLLGEKATFQGEVWLTSADIGGSLECKGSIFDNKASRALNADRSKVKGNVCLDVDKTDQSNKENTQFLGEVRFLGTEIGGSLSCIGSMFANQNGNSLYADGVKIKENLFLYGGAKFFGTVRIINAEIGGVLDCMRSTFFKPDGTAFSAEGSTIKGNVFLNSTIQGEVNFTNSILNSHFLCACLEMSTSSWSLRLSHARVGVLLDDKRSWPKPGRLWLDGFKYDRLDENAEWGLANRLDWLSRYRNESTFNPQPHEQLAAVYREAGREADAKEVLIAKNERMLDAMREALPELPEGDACKPAFLRWPMGKRLRILLGAVICPLPSIWLCHASYWVLRLLGKVCAHGYKPGMAVIWWLRIWVPTCVLVWLFNAFGLIVPTYIDLNPATNSTIGFSAPGYAFDLMTPIFDMGYTMAWTPDNFIVTLILLVIGTAGYILVALFAASITGLIRR